MRCLDAILFVPGMLNDFLLLLSRSRFWFCYRFKRPRCRVLPRPIAQRRRPATVLHWSANASLATLPPTSVEICHHVRTWMSAPFVRTTATLGTLTVPTLMGRSSVNVSMGTRVTESLALTCAPLEPMTVIRTRRA
eukprot:582929-Rhodomonas_salina.1